MTVHFSRDRSMGVCIDSMRNERRSSSSLPPLSSQHALVGKDRHPRPGRGCRTGLSRSHAFLSYGFWWCVSLSFSLLSDAWVIPPPNSVRSSLSSWRNDRTADSTTVRSRGVHSKSNGQTSLASLSARRKPDASSSSSSSPTPSSRRMTKTTRQSSLSAEEEGPSQTFAADTATPSTLRRRRRQSQAPLPPKQTAPLATSLASSSSTSSSTAQRRGRTRATSSPRGIVVEEPFSTSSATAQMEGGALFTSRSTNPTSQPSSSKPPPMRLSQSTVAYTASEDRFLYRSLLQHDILTKEQEFHLGMAVQRSMQLQREIEALLNTKAKGKSREQPYQPHPRQSPSHRQKTIDISKYTADEVEVVSGHHPQNPSMPDDSYLWKLYHRQQSLTTFQLDTDDSNYHHSENYCDKDSDEEEDAPIWENNNLLSAYGMHTPSLIDSGSAATSGGTTSFTGTTRPPNADDQQVMLWLQQQEGRLQFKESGTILAKALRIQLGDSTMTNNVSHNADDDRGPTEDSDQESYNRLGWNTNNGYQETLVNEEECSNIFSSIPGSHLLTERDIREGLGVAGGRREIMSILLRGAQARDTLIQSNYKLVVGIAKRWARMNAMQDTNAMYAAYAGTWDRPSVNEAIQEGILGLAKAAERFQPKRNLRFSTYATHWVTNAVRQCFKRASTGVLRVPTNYHETRSRFRALVKHYHITEGHVPGIDQLADEMGIAPRRLQLILRMTRPLLSADQPRRLSTTIRPGKAGNDNLDDALLISDTLVDTEPPPEDRVELSFLRQSLENAMATELAPHERDVIRLRLGLDDGVTRTCKEVADEYGGRVSTSEIRSTEKRAFKKLRSPQALATYKLLAYLDFAGVDKETITLR